MSTHPPYLLPWMKNTCIFTVTWQWTNQILGHKCQLTVYSRKLFFFYFPSQTFNNIVKQKGFPLPKYKASGNLLQQYCCNIVWQYCHNIAAILDFTCKFVSGSSAAITLSGNTAKTVHKSSFGNITAILTENIIIDQYCRSSGNNTYEIMA